MRISKNTVKCNLFELVSFVSGLLTIGSALNSIAKLRPRGNFNPKLDKNLKIISWCLILIAVVASFIIASMIIQLGVMLGMNQYITFIMAVSIPTAVLIPTIMQAKEDKILTLFIDPAFIKG